MTFDASLALQVLLIGHIAWRYLRKKEGLITAHRCQPPTVTDAARRWIKGRACVGGIGEEEVVGGLSRRLRRGGTWGLEGLKSAQRRQLRLGLPSVEISTAGSRVLQPSPTKSYQVLPSPTVVTRKLWAGPDYRLPCSALWIIVWRFVFINGLQYFFFYCCCSSITTRLVFYWRIISMWMYT